VQKAVYDALTKEKRAGESFTSLLRRLLEHHGGLEEVLGSWGRSAGSTGRSPPQKRRARMGRQA
jgi:predicted CopG family antitoxin